MSKIAKIPVIISEGVTAENKGNSLFVTGPKGSVEYKIPSSVTVSINDGKIFVKQNEASKALTGLARASIANIITGVSKGFEKKLELSGVGYRAQVNGSELSLFVGYSHPVKFQAEEGIKFSIAENLIVISGIDKTLVGNTAAKIRMVRPPEPYKGKGIKYQGERVRRKAGKAAKAVGAK